MLRTYAGAARSVQVNGRIILTSTNGFSSVPPPPPPSESPKSGSKIGTKLFLTVLGTTALTTATLAYAKKNQDLRDILKDYMPWTDDAIAMMYGEKDNPVSSAISTTRNFASSASDMIFGSSKEPPKADIAPLKPVTPKPAPKKTDLLAPVEAPKPIPPPVIENIPVIIEKAVVEDVFEIEAAGRAAINAYKRAVETLNNYARKADAIMESSSDHISQHILDELKSSTISTNQAEDDVKKAAKKLDEVLGGGKGPVAERTRRDVEKVRDEYDRASASASFSKRYWPQVEQARRYFIEELQAMFPDADIGAQKLDLHGGNPDALLLLALRRVLLYQQMLARQENYLTQRVENALTGTDEDLIRAKVEVALDKERQRLALLNQKKELIAQGQARQNLETELKKQLDLHALHLQDAIQKCTVEVAKLERHSAEERSENQKTEHELKLAAVLGRLQGVDDALKARSDADKMARQSQKLWAACEALESALRRDTSAPMPLSRELDAISTAAAESDELVTAVLRGVPSAVRDRGVFSELALRERFNNVESACRRVALVPEEGASLPVYFLSWLQSLLIIKNFPISKEEINDQTVEFSKLETFEILQRVRYWVDRCDWSQALRYIHLLRGAPSSVARDWADEVTLHLEARQAARALLAHASATGLLYL